MEWTLDVPAAVETALRDGGALAASISGGKDGQAMLRSLAAARPVHGWTGAFVALHADLGRFEWPQTAAAVEAQAAQAQARLIVVRRPRGDLLQRIEQEADRLEGTGRMVWPSSKGRYCNAEMKRDQLVKAQRRLGPVVVSAQGLRAQESTAREARAVLSIEGRATARRLQRMTPAEALRSRRGNERLVLNWLPVHGMPLDEVWRACGTSAADLERRRTMARDGDEAGALDGWPCHPAYVLGNTRVSCACCIMGSAGDLANGVRRVPALAAGIAALEVRTGQTFRKNVSVAAMIEAQREETA